MARSFVAVTAGSGTKLGTNNYTDGADSKHDELTVLGEQFLPSYIVNESGAGAAISVATATDHLLQVMAGATNKVRVRWIDIYQSAMATAALMGDIWIYRLTTAGTGGTAQTVSALDPADASAGATAMSRPTVKGTLGGGIYFGKAYFMQTLGASNQLSEPIFRIDFDRPRMKPLIIAAGTTNGIAIYNGSAVAGATVWINVGLDESPY